MKSARYFYFLLKKNKDTEINFWAFPADLELICKNSITFSPNLKYIGILQGHFFEKRKFCFRLPYCTQK